MTISYHLDDATLVAYAAGTPDESVHIVVASHLALCGVCRDNLHIAEQMGGIILDKIEPARLEPDAFNQLLARLDDLNDDAADAAQKPPARRQAETGVPHPLQHHLHRHANCTLEEVKWTCVAPGISVCKLPLSPRASGELKLVRVEAGKQVPEHSHSGCETTLVLQGIFRDENGTFGAGDISELEGNAVHSPMIGGEEACICLVAIEGRCVLRPL